jgi:hypothetical protein
VEGAAGAEKGGSAALSRRFCDNQWFNKMVAATPIATPLATNAGARISTAGVFSTY